MTDFDQIDFDQIEFDLLLNAVFYDIDTEYILNSVINHNTDYIAKYLLYKANQKMVDKFYSCFNNYLLYIKEDDYAMKKFTQIKANIGKILYVYFKVWASDCDSLKPYELKLSLGGKNFIFGFLEGVITTENKKFYTYYESKFKDLLYMFDRDNKFLFKESDDKIEIELYYSETLRETYILVPREIACPVCKKKHKEQIQYNFCSYGCGTVYCGCGNEYYTIDDMPVRGHNPKCGYIEDDGIDSFERVTHPSTIFKESDLKSHNICPGCNKNNDKEQVTIYDNDCGTVWCDCGLEYYIVDGKCLINHSASCGEDYSDVDSVEEYRKSIELHNKINHFYHRKMIFRSKFSSDDIITKTSLPEDMKERIFAKFDDLSDRFRDKYGGVRSFLPYQYIFSKLLLEEGYVYPYTCTEAKYKAMEDLYWSVKDAKDYSNFINFLKSPTQSEDFEIYDSPKKVVIQRSLSRGNTTVYLLTVKGDFDLALQYFTKVLPKLGKNPEYRYNIFILDMKEKLKLETISLNDVINYMISYVINELMYFAEEL